MSLEGKLTLADLDAFLELPAATPEVTAYLDAAAVLVAFDPLRLRPVGRGGRARNAAGPPPQDVLEQLLPVCEQSSAGPVRGLWALRLSERRTALSRLVAADAVSDALRAHPNRPHTALQRLFERVVGGQSVGLHVKERDELVALLTLHDWLDGILDGPLPEKAEIRAALTHFDLFQPMRRLADQNFVGRKKELTQLTAYFRQGSNVPLFVFGPGGIGKSTLLSKAILDVAVPDGMPVAYVDVDRPTIRPDQPATLLLDVIAQLEPQINLPRGAAEAVAKEVSGSLGRGDASQVFESAVSAADDFVVDVFGNVVGSALGGRRALLVVDTFEEVQFLGPEVVWTLVSFLRQVKNTLPGLQMVLAGRALPLEYVAQLFPEVMPSFSDADEREKALAGIALPNRPINLGALEPRAARQLLRAAAGLSERQIGARDLDDVIGVVSRNPMCLRLAGRLLREEGVEKLRESRAEFLSELRAEKIQALLYGRILRHVHHEDARAIAYPGLVVRRLDPAVIREVLAEPCGVKLTPARTEFDIYNDLRDEAALVEVDPADGSLRHRTDVRRVMLADLLDHVDEEVVMAIDERAVKFYEPKPDVISRGEELYHRLRMGEPPEVLDYRWVPEAGERLKNAGPELAAQQQLWLAAKLGITLDESVRRTASQEAWEDQAARSVERFLRSNAPKDALAVLAERKERLPRSKLFALEADAHRLAGKPKKALAVARAGVDSATKAGAVDMAAELLLQMVVIQEGAEDYAAASQLLDEARAVASHSNNALLHFRVDVTGLRVHRHLLPDSHSDRAEDRQRLNEEVTDELLRSLRTRPVLLREAAAELGKDNARITALAIETLGIEVASDAQAEAFGRAIAKLDKANLVTVSPTLTFGDWATQFEEQDFDSKVIRRVVSEELTGRDTRALRTAVASISSGDEVLRDFRSYFRAGVDDIMRMRGPSA